MLEDKFRREYPFEYKKEFESRDEYDEEYRKSISRLYGIAKRNNIRIEQYKIQPDSFAIWKNGEIKYWLEFIRV